MIKRKVALLVLMVMFAAGIFASSVFAGPQYQTFTGLECVYLEVPGETWVTGNMLHISSQVNRNVFISDNPDVVPDGIHNFVMDVTVNLVSGKATWKGKGTFYPEGMGVWNSMGVGQIDLVAGTSTGTGVFQGTEDYQGMTIKVNLSQGDLSRCQEGAFDASNITGFIVPTGD